MKKFISFFSLFCVLNFLLLFSGCNGPVPNSNKKNNSSDGGLSSSSNVEPFKKVLSKVKEEQKIALLPFLKKLTPKDTLWCKLEAQRSIVEMMNVSFGAKNYREALGYLNKMPEEKSGYFLYNITSHLKNMGCVEDIKNSELKFKHSIVPIDKNLKFLNAFLCTVSEKLIFTQQVSLRVDRDMDYQKSLKVFKSFDDYQKNQVINILTNYLEERSCAK